MLKPTKKNQQTWIRQHLNGGSYSDIEQYHDEVNRKEQQDTKHEHACYVAMEWLDHNDIRSLQEAWDQCRRVDWLDWMIDHMEPTYAERVRWYNLRWGSRPYPNVDTLRAKTRNPWVLKNWRKGLFRK